MLAPENRLKVSLLYYYLNYRLFQQWNAFINVQISLFYCFKLYFFQFLHYRQKKYHQWTQKC